MIKNNNALSVIIPSRNSPFLTKTIEDVLAKAEGEIEVIINVDDNPPEKEVADSRVTYLYPPNSPIGLRQAINACAARAKGKYIMKTDDHCMFAPGFDKALVENMQNNWIVVPSRYSLDAENWVIETNRKPRRDYHYLCYPDPHKGHDQGMHGVEWWDRGKERSDPKYDIDDTPSFQGSCWFMAKDYFDNFLGGMHEEEYGQFAQETQEITLKAWLSGGTVKVNKKTWYAHLRKGRRYGRMYSMPPGNVEACNWSARHWVNNEEPGMIHKFEWLVNEKFPNMPTWPPDWEQKLTDEGVIKKVI